MAGRGWLTWLAGEVGPLAPCPHARPALLPSAPPTCLTLTHMLLPPALPPLCSPFSSPLQVLGSIVFIMMYYYRRITWRLRNRKGKQRIARAARDALALKKKNSDTFDLHVTASAATSVTDRVRGLGWGCGWLVCDV